MRRLIAVPTPHSTPMRLLFACVFVVVALLGGPAVAAGIDEVQVEIDLRDPDVARYELTLDYVTEDFFDVKEDGFKFVGRDPIRNLKLIEPPGSSVTRAEGYHEERVEFTLRRGERGDPLPISFSFERDAPSGTRSWRSTEYDFPWASTFGVGVGRATTILLVPRDWSITGFQCMRKRDHQVCERTTPHLEPVVFSVEQRSSLALNVLGVALAMLLLGAGFIFGGRWAEQNWLKARGVLPVHDQPPAPPLSKGYRAPAPLPVQSELQPVLPPEDRAMFERRLRIAFGLGFAGLLTTAFLFPGRVSSPLWIWFGLYGLISAGACTLVASQNFGWQWLPALVAMGFAAFPLFRVARDVFGVSDDGFFVFGITAFALLAAFSSRSGSGRSSGGHLGGGCGGGCGGGGCGGGGCGGCGG